MIWLAAASSILIAIVTESSEGNDQIQEWPPMNFVEWLPHMLYVVVAVLVEPVSRLGSSAGLSRTTQFRAWPGSVGSVLVLFSDRAAVAARRRLALCGGVGKNCGQCVASAAVVADVLSGNRGIGRRSAWLRPYLADRFAPMLGFLLVPLFVAGDVARGPAAGTARLEAVRG